MTKRIRMGLLLIILIAGIFLIYWFYLAEPTDFPEDDKLIKEMSEKLDHTEVISIQDRQFIDQEHVFIPYKTDSNGFGISHWLWEKHEWKLINTDDGTPLVWKVDPDDPSSYVITWNLSPKDQINSLSFYLMNERGYRVSNEKHFYTPGVQMEKRFTSLSNSYGVMGMPDDWAFYLEKQSEITAKDRHLFFANPQLHFGWSAFDQNGERLFPRPSGNTNGYNAGYGEFQFVLLKDDADFENVNN